jgi:hypothetical protein
MIRKYFSLDLFNMRFKTVNFTNLFMATEEFYVLCVLGSPSFGELFFIYDPLFITMIVKLDFCYELSICDHALKFGGDYLILLRLHGFVTMTYGKFY